MNTLPPELLDKIASHLVPDCDAICQFRLTCRFVAHSVDLQLWRKCLDLSNVDHAFFASRFASRITFLILQVAERPQVFQIPSSVTRIKLTRPDTLSKAELDTRDNHEEWATRTVLWINSLNLSLEQLDTNRISSNITPIALSLKCTISKRKVQAPVFYSGLQHLKITYFGRDDVVYSALIAAKLSLKSLSLSFMIINPEIKKILPPRVDLDHVRVVGSLKDCFEGWVGEYLNLFMIEHSQGDCIFPEDDSLPGPPGHIGRSYAPATSPIYYNLGE